MSITDYDRLNTLKLLFKQEGKTSAQQLPFSKSKLDYLRPLLVRLDQASVDKTNMTNHSSIMLRQMIDELILEIIAQINWSIGTNRTLKRKKVLSDFGLNAWSQFASPIVKDAAKVA